MVDALEKAGVITSEKALEAKKQIANKFYKEERDRIALEKRKEREERIKKSREAKNGKK